MASASDGIEGEAQARSHYAKHREGFATVAPVITPAQSVAAVMERRPEGARARQLYALSDGGALAMPARFMAPGEEALTMPALLVPEADGGEWAVPARLMLLDGKE